MQLKDYLDKFDKDFLNLEFIDNNFYQNNILNDIQGRYYTSVEMLKYLFAKEQTESLAKDRITNYTKWFWDNIENYFMGIIPNEVKAAITKK